VCVRAGIGPLSILRLIRIVTGHSVWSLDIYRDIEYCSNKKIILKK
jgi:hypothetical protein